MSLRTDSYLQSIEIVELTICKMHMQRMQSKLIEFVLFSLIQYSLEIIITSMIRKVIQH